MGIEHLVKVTAYITDASHVGIYRTARDAAVGDAKPASTLIVIPALAGPEWCVEIEAIAAA